MHVHLETAIRNADIEKMKEILSKGINLNVHIGDEGDFWNTPLTIVVDVCCERGKIFNRKSVEMVRYLLKYGADPDFLKNIGINAFYLAFYNNHLEIAELCLQHGTNPSIVNQKRNHLSIPEIIEKRSKFDKNLSQSMLHLCDNYLHLFDERDQKKIKALRLYHLFLSN